jgi:hypothetical protein
MMNYNMIIRSFGDNKYKVPHMNKERLERLGELPITIMVEQGRDIVPDDEYFEGSYQNKNEILNQLDAFFIDHEEDDENFLGGN